MSEDEIGNQKNNFQVKKTKQLNKVKKYNLYIEEDAIVSRSE